MRAIFLLTLLVAQLSYANECFRVDSDSPQTIVLRGVIEYRSTPIPHYPDAFETWLRLASPICVRGVARDGLPFKKENVKAIGLGIPQKLMGRLQPLDQVTLRGELQGPAVNGETFGEAVDNVIFAIKECFKYSPPDAPSGTWLVCIAPMVER